MKISEVLKKRAYSFSEIEDIEVIACDDSYGIALTCTTCNGILTYDIYTLDKSYRLKLLNTFLGSKESAECAYNSFMESVRTKRKPKFSDYKFILEDDYYTVYLNLFGRDVPQWTFSRKQYESGYAEKYVREFMPKREIGGLDEK